MMAGERARLRPLEADDMLRALDWVNDPAVAFSLGRCRPVTRHEHERWYASVIENASHVFFAIEDREEGLHVGNIWLWGIHPQNRSAELRIMIGSGAHRGRGIGTEAVRLLLEFAFLRLNLHKVFLYVLASNEAAVKAFGRAGLVVEGTLRDEFYVSGEYEDVLRMAILRPDWEAR
jgi:RimJ/RimL family protein N-acetyltransferase